MVTGHRRGYYGGCTQMAQAHQMMMLVRPCIRHVRDEIDGGVHTGCEGLADEGLASRLACLLDK